MKPMRESALPEPCPPRRSRSRILTSLSFRLVLSGATAREPAASEKGCGLRYADFTGTPDGATAIALVPPLPLAVTVALAMGLAMGVCGTLGNALVQTAANPTHLGRATSVMMLTAAGPAPLSHPA